MGEWRKEKLEDCLERLIDYRGKSPKKSPKGIPVLSAKVVKTAGLLHPIEQTISEEYYPQWMVRGYPRAGDIVLTTEGPMGEVVQLDERTASYALGQRIVCLRAKQDVLDNGFLRYLLISPRQQDILTSFATGTTVLGISQKALRSVPIEFPPLPEQRAIAAVLSALDDKIELNRRMNATLEAMARAIFRDWFVTFGPTRAKATGQPPYLSPETWSLFPDRLDDEGKPEGWEMGTLGDVADTNAASWTAKNHPDQVEYVDLSNTKWGTIESTAKLPWKKAPSRARRIARAGDTIIGTTRPGNGSFAYIARDGLTVSTGFAVLTPKRPEFRDFVYIAASNPENIRRLANLADGHGGAYPAVRPAEVSDTRVAIPPDGVIDAFANVASPLRARIEFNKSENETLAQTRDLLLPKLMSGEIRVREAENIMEGVA
jgi:type I restriction enzyme S subunit